MPYDDAFFERYRNYLAEPLVRKNHDRAFTLWLHDILVTTVPSVIDLGCAIGEYQEHGLWRDYVGIDVTPRIKGSRTIAADFAFVSSWLPRLQSMEQAARPFNAFVSLFSIEPALQHKDRYALYRRLFAELPDLRWGLSAGFYYRNRAAEDVVPETGDLWSCQTIEPLGAFEIPGVIEERFMMATPSAMFGDDVVEVYKFFTRKASP